MSRAILGSVRAAQRRYVLHQRGVRHVLRSQVRDREWQVCQQGVEKLLDFLPMIETIYPLASSLWNSSAAEPLVLVSHGNPGDPDILYMEDVTLQRFQWLSRGRIHAGARYVCDLTGEGAREEIWVPFVWYGTYPQQARGPSGLREASPFLTAPESASNLYCNPGVVVVAHDDFAGFRASRDLASDVALGIVSTGGRLIAPLSPAPPEWRWHGGQVRSIKLGSPEQVAAEVEGNPKLADHRGVR